MPDLPLSFEQGLDESQEDSLLPDATASLLENWVPEPNGGLRARRAWSNGSTVSAPATRRARGIGFFSLDNQTGDVKVKVGSFAKSTAAAPVSQSVSGLGFTPKAIIFFTAGPTATGFDDARPAVGFTTGASESYSVSAASETGATTSNSARRMAAKALTLVFWDATTSAECDLTSFGVDGFTVTWTTNNARATVINYIAIGGADVTNAKVVTWQSPAASGNKAVTGVGFQPSLVLNATTSQDTGTALPASAANALFSLGTMDSSGNQWANGFWSSDGASPSDTQRVQYTNASVAIPTIGLADWLRASYVSMDSDGFTTNFSATGSATARHMMSLCLKVSSLGRAKVGSFSKDTGAAPDPQSVTGVGFTPTGVMLSSIHSAAATAPMANTSWGLGAVSAAGSEKSIAVRDDDAEATTDAQGYQNDFPLSLVDEVTASTLDAQFDFTSFDSDGFTGSWTTNDATASQVLYLALGATTGGAGIDKILVAHNDVSTNFDIYALNTTQLDTGTWSAIDSDIAVTDTLPAVAFASGLGQVLYTHKKFSLARRWDGTTAASIAGSPPGRCIGFHKNRFFVGGTEANSTRLWYSDLASYSSWPATNYIEIGHNDGEAIEDLAVFENGLLIAKRNSLWFLSGASPDEFSVQPLNAGGGHVGRSIVATPYGAVIAGKRQVWLWAGGGVERISGPIEESYNLTSADFVSTAYINGETYICDESTGTTFVVDMQRGAWRIEKLASPTTEGPAIVIAKGDRLYYGPQSATTMSLVAYREMPGSSRGRDAGLAITYRAYTPEIWPVDPGKAFTPRHLLVKYRQRGGDASQTGVTVTPYYDGIADTPVPIPAQAAAGTYRKAIGIGSKKGIRSALFRFEQTVPSTQESVIDLEEVLLAFEDVGPRRSG